MKKETITELLLHALKEAAIDVHYLCNHDGLFWICKHTACTRYRDVILNATAKIESKETDKK